MKPHARGLLSVLLLAGAVAVWALWPRLGAPPTRKPGSD